MKRTIKIKGKAPKIARGHTPHRSGSGVHEHRCTKRLRTRSSKLREALTY